MVRQVPVSQAATESTRRVHSWQHYICNTETARLEIAQIPNIILTGANKYVVTVLMVRRRPVSSKAINHGRETRKTRMGLFRA